MTDLKPCPFCGGEGSAYQVLDYPEKIGPRFSVICNGCGASVTTIFQSEWTAIEAWNRRAERTCHDEAGSPMSFLCGECGWFWNDPEDELGFRYCPSCGARVVGE